MSTTILPLSIAGVAIGFFLIIVLIAFIRARRLAKLLPPPPFKWPSLIGLLLLFTRLWAGTAGAQPIMVTEHDWTFQAGNGRYGILQANLLPGDLNRRTTVYCGSALFTVSMRAEVLIALTVVSLAGLGTVVLMSRRGRE